MLNCGDPVDISSAEPKLFAKRKTMTDWRNIKIFGSGECRRVCDYSIFRVNDLEVFSLILCFTAYLTIINWGGNYITEYIYFCDIK